MTEKEITASHFGGAPVQSYIGPNMYLFLHISTIQKYHLHTGVTGETTIETRVKKLVLSLQKFLIDKIQMSNLKR
jgi:hypothetical protein